jgi:hypothetical protein
VTARHRARPAAQPWRPLAAAGSGVRALLFLAAGLLLAPLPAEATPASTAMLRLAQLTPDLDGVELVMSSVADPGDSAMAAALGYGELSPYQSVEPGDYVIGVRTAGSADPPMVSRTLAVEPGTAYTVGAISARSEGGLAVFVDDLAAPDPDRTRVRVINAAPPAPEMDFRVAPDAQWLGLVRGAAGAYQAVAPGALRLAIGPPGEPPVELPVTVAANQVASVVVTSDEQGLRARVVTDAGGPAVVPPGPVHAGLGGTAAERPGGPAGSAALFLLAAGAAALSVRLARYAR